MKTKIKILAMTSALALAVMLVGCDRTVSHEEKSTVKSDGTVKTQEKTVTEKSDGSVIKTEETKKTEPVKP
jgi:ribose 5-phosphate isomerase